MGKRYTLYLSLGVSLLVHAAFAFCLCKAMPVSLPLDPTFVEEVFLVYPRALHSSAASAQAPSASTETKTVSYGEADARGLEAEAPKAAPAARADDPQVVSAPAARADDPQVVSAQSSLYSPAPLSQDAPGAPSSISGSLSPAAGYQATDGANAGQAVPAYDIDSYRSRVFEIINRNKAFPDIARRRGIEGAVDLKFTIDCSGKVSNIEVVKISGISALDRASIQCIQECSFPPPPSDSVTLPATITFRLLKDSRS